MNYQILNVKNIILLFSMLTILGSIETCAQGKYLIYFKNKTNTPYTISKPSQFLSERAIKRRQKQNIPIRYSDLPVNPEYPDSLKKLGLKVWYTSRWFNAAYAYIPDTNNIKDILALGFVKNIQVIKPTNDTSSPEKSSGGRKAKGGKYEIQNNNYGPSYSQLTMICADEMHSQGYHGEGMQIAIFDGGFNKANTLFFFDSLNKSNRILDTYDFVNNDKYVYGYSDHGTNVLSTIGAYASGSLIGTAYKASFYLFRTEDGDSEYPIEEANWLIAAEKSDSLGVDVINSSLGYTVFDDPKLSYSYAQRNGRTAISSRAANMAASVGMLVVVSAANSGNDRNDPYIACPSDADSVLTVGAVDANKKPASFSSIGPRIDGKIKPEVACQGIASVIGSPNGTIITGNGTSFSAPIMTGMVTGLWQSLPYLTNMEVIDLVKRSASQYDSPDNKIGYGIPCYFKAQLLSIGRSNVVISDQNVFPNPFSNENLNLIVNQKDVNKKISIDIYDTSAKNIYKQNIDSTQITNQLSISSGSLIPGLYFVRISGEGFVKVIKLIKN